MKMTEEKKEGKVEETAPKEEAAVKAIPQGAKSGVPVEAKAEAKVEPKAEPAREGKPAPTEAKEAGEKKESPSGAPSGGPKDSHGQGGRRGKGGRRGFRRPRYEEEEEEWIPKTTLGKRVKAGEITDIDEILKSGAQIMEKGIVDTLLPGLNEEVLDVRRVQRTLDSGRRMRFRILVVVGDKNGHVGVGIAKGTEVGPTIRKAITRAKLNITSVSRSCASWECGCGEPHTVPFEVLGKEGSVTVTLKPAPKGVGLVAGDNSKTILDFAGIKDVWTFSKGHTRTVINQVLATYAALKELSRFKEGAKKKK